MTKSPSEKKKRARLPISSFSPELMTTLKRGSQERIVLTFTADRGGKPVAHKFHRRLHALRAAMHEENHPEYQHVAKAYCSIFWGRKAVENGGPPEWAGDYNGNLGAIIVIRPRDSEFSDVLANISSSKQPDLRPEEPTPIAQQPSAGDETEELDDLMEDLSEIVPALEPPE